MKTTFDLPEDLVRTLKTRAAQSGIKMKDLATQLLRSGLNQTAPSPQPIIRKHPITGLPVIQGSPPSTPHPQMTHDEIKEALLAQEVEWALESS